LHIIRTSKRKETKKEKVIRMKAIKMGKQKRIQKVEKLNGGFKINSYS
jgi:hypothetical protein